jgi:UDP-glucuronate decarboxylase
MKKERPIFERKNVLITGGAGFIGSHLCDRLVKDHKVICVDNFITGSEENINHLLKDPNFEFIRHDMVEPLELEKLPELKAFKVEFQGVQEVFNLACPTSPKDYNKYPIETLLANAYGTKNALDIAQKYQAKFLHLSTSSVYGEPREDVSFPENYWGYINPIGPRSCYNEGKRFAESLVMNYRNKYKFDAKIVRVFNTYGPRMKLTDGRMIPDFINQALNNQPIVIYGSKEDKGAFCYISDFIEGLVRMMKSKEFGPINLGQTKTYTYFEVAEKVINLTGSQSKIKYEAPLPYTAKQGIPNIQQAKEKLGWFPIVDLDEGLKRTTDYMKGSKVVGIEYIKI